MQNKTKSLLFVLIFSAISTLAHSNPNPSQLVVNVGIKTESWGNGIVINGSSNLPHGTNLLISLKSISSDFMPQSTAVVSEGFFSSGPMANQGNFQPGEYIIYIISRPHQFQPRTVQQLLGTKGEFLVGNQVVQLASGERVVEAKFRFIRNPE